jgi:hypothetical protein
MNPVTEIFAAFDDSPTKLARATGLKVQTVHDWKRKAPIGIPEWRRSVVLDAVKIAAKKSGKPISPATLAYLGAPAEKPARKPVEQTSVAA